jgi:hypothetical protein
MKAPTFGLATQPSTPAPSPMEQWIKQSLQALVDGAK